MLPHERLLHWFGLEDRTEQLDRFSTVFLADAEMDGELSPVDRVLPMVEHFAALEDVRPVAAQGDAERGVVVIEACDPVTGLWHRTCWVFEARDGLISKVVATTSQGLPSPEARARVPRPAPTLAAAP